MQNSSETLRQELVSAITKTMENMTFADVEFADDEAETREEGENKLWAILPVEKPFRARLMLEIPRECGQLLAAEVFGQVQGNASEETVYDMVAEMLNTISGRFLRGVVPENETFKLGLPEKGTGERAPEMKQDLSIRWHVGEIELKVIFSAESQLN